MIIKTSVIGKSDDARDLAGALKCNCNDKSANLIIRYGDTSFKNENNAYEINNFISVRNAKNKYLSLLYFKEDNLLTPKFSLCWEYLRFPILGRELFHTRGTDIKHYKNKKDCTHSISDYFIEYHHKRDEYRCHILFDKCVSLAAKTGVDTISICRNLNTGWTYKEIKEYNILHRKIINISIKAIKSLGLDFGAVDLIVSKGKIYLLEVNTAPGLIPRRIKIYAKEIKGFIERIF